MQNHKEVRPRKTVHPNHRKPCLGPDAVVWYSVAFCFPVTLETTMTKEIVERNFFAFPPFHPWGI